MKTMSSIHRLRVFPLLAAALLFPGSVSATEANLRYAEGFRVESMGNATLVTVTPEWRRGSATFRYLLVPRGESPPPDAPPAQVVPVPVRRIVVLSTTYLAYMDAAGLVDRIVALSDFRHVNTPSVRRMIDDGALREVGNFSKLRVERVMELAPDLILTPASGAGFDIHPKLIEAGLPTALVVDHLEADPLARCEWIKFLALFFGAGERAAELFREIEGRYLALAEKGRAAEDRPTVLINTPFQGQWWAPRGQSYVARLIRDAGGDYLWADTQGVGSEPMDIETVYDRALTADVWINTGLWTSLEDALSADPRFAEIRPLKTGRVFNNNKRLNPWGGNDYWESGVLRPDVILADLIKIFQPALAPDHELFYYRRLEGATP
ncbi:MAG: ABC transporter substrate-binding protein [Desulfococcaceae bacterium]